MFHSYAYGVPRAERQERMKQLLTLVDLWDRRKGKTRTYSGGMKRRLEIVRGLIHHPRVLFLDEPTASLDPSSTRSIENLISQNVKNGRNILMVTQNVAQAERLGDAVIFVHKGRIVEHTASSRFFSHSKSSVARAFLVGELEP